MLARENLQTFPIDRLSTAKMVKIVDPAKLSPAMLATVGAHNEKMLGGLQGRNLAT